ncbi:DUF554 domain-containing protein [Desulfitibacter alkalitolerans]|uniref:DUF554 domain-containing protein n=1 Tax=Desulfitibacter alkalitolerans TaxID=264641 RepID=UPI000482E293|nr:DUF554 domain-containing protein [Desulfitibacter alkalitolerans]
MWGTVVNSFAIVFGTIIGMWFGRRFSENIRKMIMQAIGLGIVLIGLKMAITSEQLVFVLISMVLGAWLGEFLDIEGALHKLGLKIQQKAGNLNGGSNIAQAFVTSTLLYCVGAMAIMGAIESGLTGNHDTLYAKSLIDGITSIMLTTTMGIGVIFSAVSVFIYQGAITLAASYLETLLTIPVVNELKAVGGLIILGIGLNILEITKIKVGNLLPAIFFIVIIMIFVGMV